MDFAECAIADANAKAANDTPQKSITEGLQRFELNDYGNLNRFASRYSPLLRYNKPTGGWLKWTGAYWKHSDTSLVTRYAIETIQNIEQERSLIVIPDDEAGKKAAAKEGASLFNWSHKSKSGPHTDWIVNHASSLPGVTLETSTLDAQINRFNVKNGTIDLTTGELLPHNPADYHTKISNFNYHPDTSSPLYDKFLLEVCDGDLEMVRFLLRAIGYSMLGSNPARVFFMLWGSSGTNGKSTLLNTLEHVFGDYAQSSHFSTFVKKPPTSGRSSDIARMRGARFVTAIETGKGESLNVPLLKTLTGGDNVTASFKFKEPFDFKPQLKLWLAMNDKPTVEETGAAIWNRVILIPFLVNFELSGRKDERLGEKLKAEADGILCRAVEGVMDYHQVGLSPPSTILNAKAEYRAEEDTLLRFLSEKCVLDPKGEIQSSHMANMYAEWCARNHEKVISGKAFTQEMRSHNHVAHKIHGVMTFEGLKTRDSAFTPSGDNIPDSEM
jgi:putative DNA primase/helicase